ncbi:MAG: CAP domain-containing protein [Nakamurella sp.]
MFVPEHALNHKTASFRAGRSAANAPRRSISRRAPLRRAFVAAAVVLSACMALSVSPMAAAAAATPARAAVVAPLVRATQTSTSAAIDRDLLVYVNKARAAYKLAPLAELTSMVGLANIWSTHLAEGPSKGTFGHNPNLRPMVISRVPTVRTYGENIATFTTGSFSAYAILKAYLASPSHRANIMSPTFRYVGIVTRNGPGGRSYNTMDFVG